MHRDIKPGNILLDTTGKPFVVDFGLALKEENIGHGPKRAGTPAYMSPEQARAEGHRVDGRSDIFSLGVVFYELLVGRKPFRADSHADLMEQITSFEPRPPRQHDDSIPKELDRICLKALSKRASERHSTAKDLAEDLRHFLAQQPSPTTTGVGSPSITPVVQPPSTLGRSATSSTPTSDHQLIKIVPKGLRSFDAEDSDFFLELLPGPRDRDGLPDSIRFWKTRIEEIDADNTFSVGLIYGPSGCGKSSLVKAGLLPRLENAVTAVYLEATGDETEARLLKGLRRQIPDLPNNLGLIESLWALRRGRFLDSGQKVLLVLDQFEQWLHAKRNEENTELVQALRHCDGERVQVIVMVRDDFWMAATRFMTALEIELLQGKNMAPVDLFDQRHAKKVLAAFGRAFGALQERADGLTKDQEAFLDQAVSGLAQEGKVISVRLALFAEMVKGKLWTPATLKDVGGMEGVGVTFLEETFAASTAPPQHRLHQKAAQAVLKALLPDIGTDIKGNMRSQQDLLEASGYAAQPKNFDTLLRILDGELRLITPTDPEGVDSENASSTKVVAGQKYYQLTHDYLVNSLRDWLTRKQKETRRGRAELLLADRAAVWNARPENRQLPSLWQWVSIRWWSQKKNWTPPQRKVMRKAGKYHAVRGLVVGVVLAVMTFTGLMIRDRVEEKQKANQAAGLVQAVLNADLAQVPAIVGQLTEYRQWADPLLRDEHDRVEAKSRQKLNASLALLPVDPGQVDYLYGRLLDAAPGEVKVIVDALAPHKEALRDKLWTVVESPQDKNPQRLRAASALANYDPESKKWTTTQKAVGDDLVAVPAVHLSLWIDSFRPVRTRLIPQLSAVFGAPGRKETERSLATDILADYAADQPQALAELVMIADAAQFAALFPKLREQSNKCLPMLAAEIAKEAPVVVAKDKLVLEKKEVIGADDPTVKPLQAAAMPAKCYEVRLEGSKKYRLTMDSKELDSFLLLQDKTGKELAFNDDGGGDLNSLLDFSPERDDTYIVFAASFKGTGSFQLKIVETVAGSIDDGKEQLAKRQANAAVALLKMSQPEKVWPLLKHSPDPRVRSYLIHRLGPLGADAGAIIKRLDEEPNITAKRALILSLGEFGEKELPPTGRTSLLAKLQTIYRTDADPGLHASAEWVLRHWKQEPWLMQMNDEWAKDRDQRDKRIEGIQEFVKKDKEKAPPQWYVNGQGQTMVVIPGPVEFLMGSPPTERDRYESEVQHKKRIGRTFALAAKPVTMAEYRVFNKTYGINDSVISKVTPSINCPVVATSWYQAAAYCNWLSKQENIREEEWCYEMDAKGQVTKLKANYLSLTGYRLPTEAEMEYATRAGATTARYYGETEELLPKYAWYLKNSQEKTWPVGSLNPNDFGFFDLQGNVFSWCQESYKAYPQGILTSEDREDGLVIVATTSRVLRGGSFISLASNVRSAYRNSDVPTNRINSFGFRPARTLPLGGFTALPATPEGGRR